MTRKSKVGSFTSNLKSKKIEFSIGIISLLADHKANPKSLSKLPTEFANQIAGAVEIERRLNEGIENYNQAHKRKNDADMRAATIEFLEVVRELIMISNIAQLTSEKNVHSMFDMLHKIASALESVGTQEPHPLLPFRPNKKTLLGRRRLHFLCSLSALVDQLKDFNGMKVNEAAKKIINALTKEDKALLRGPQKEKVRHVELWKYLLKERERIRAEWHGWLALQCYRNIYLYILPPSPIVDLPGRIAKLRPTKYPRFNFPHENFAQELLELYEKNDEKELLAKIENKALELKELFENKSQNTTLH